MKKEFKRHYYKLKRMATGQPGTLDFEEPKVQGLWRMAQEFSSEELDRYGHKCLGARQAKKILIWVEGKSIRSCWGNTYL